MLTRNDSPDIRIEHGGSPLVSKGDDCVCGVGADAWKAEEVVPGLGEFAAPFFCDRYCTFAKAKCPPGVAKVSPRDDNFRRRGGREVCWCWPTLKPFVPRRHDSCDGCLLAHYFADEDCPCACPGFAPGKGARSMDVPRDELVVHRISVPYPGGDAECVEMVRWRRERFRR